VTDPLETAPAAEPSAALALEAVKSLMAKPGVAGVFVTIITNDEKGEPQFGFGADLVDGADFDTLAGCAVEGLGALRQTFK
jgi:hypothetical protein